MVALRRDTPTGHEASIISLELSESSPRDPFLKALLRSTEHQVGKRGRVATKAGIFEQASARGGLRFHQEFPSLVWFEAVTASTVLNSLILV